MDNTTKPSGTQFPDRHTWLTIPNLLCAIRIFGSPFLLVLAGYKHVHACFVLVLVLFLTDWLDGKIARWLHQESAFGARLDSLADATFYTAVLITTLLLWPDRIRQEALWIGMAIISYPVNARIGWLKFRVIPTYHTRLAKTSWFLVGLAVISLFLDGPDWLLRLAAGAVLLTNLEQVAISLVLTRPEVNVLSIFHAWKIRSGKP